MEQNIQNQGGVELAERVKTALAETQHRYELHDPFAETTLRFQTAEAVTAKAEELGTTRFQHRESDNTVKQVDKVDGQWWVRNEPLAPQNSQQPPAREDKPLSSVQEAIDREALSGIEIRAEQRAIAGQGVDAATDKQMALADAHAFRRIENPAWQESAAVEMANNTREYPEYKDGLDKAIPGYPGTAAKVYALNAANEEKIALKEVGKEMDFAAMTADAREKGVPMESLPGKVMVYNPERGVAGAEILNEDGSRITFGGKEAIAKFAEENKLSPNDLKVLNDLESRADVFRNPARTEEMSINPLDMERVAAARSRDTAEARQALGLNSIEPNIEKEQQKLEGEAEERRSAWLKKGAEKTVTQEKPATGNKVESDEIFTATQSDVKPVIPPDVEKQYLRVGDKFYHPKDTANAAFEDKGNKLESRSNSENVAESMVRIAKARGWDEIKVAGSESFRKEAWLEAAKEGMHVKGYSPSEQDKVELAKHLSKSAAKEVATENKPAKDVEAEKNKDKAKTFANESGKDAVKKYPELAGAVAAVAVMDKKAEADGLNPSQRKIVAARVRENVANSIERGEATKIAMKEQIEVKREISEEREFGR